MQMGRVTLGNVCELTATLTLNLIFYQFKENFKGFKDGVGIKSITKGSTIFQGSSDEIFTICLSGINIPG